MERIRQDMIDGMAAALAGKLNTAGGIMTGDLTIDKANPLLDIDKSGSGQAAMIRGQTNDSTRWSLVLGNTAAESSTQTGSDFELVRHNNAGAVIDTPFSVDRLNGNPSFKGRRVTEYITNANGNAVRFFDGTQICWRNWVGATRAPNTTMMDSFTFPAAFSSEPACSGSTSEYGNVAPGGATFYTYEVVASATTLWLRGRFDYSANLTYTARWIAIGRWY